MSDKLVEDIIAGRFTRKELENLYANAQVHGRSDVLAAAKVAMREIDQRSYTKRFVKPIKDKVKQTASEIAEAESWGRWEGNVVDNGIKAGGPMLSGEVLAEFYFSYRHPTWKNSSYLAVFQESEASAVAYKVKAHGGEQRIVNTNEEAVALFRLALH